MGKFTIVVPEYSQRFRCVGAACGDNCCSGWTVLVDRLAVEKYATVPAGDLRSQLDASIRPAAAPGGNASIRMLPSGECPLLTDERLCRIQCELGEGYLCRTCADYPRLTHTIDGIEERALTLSCPEAARLVLLDPELRTSPRRRHKARWRAPLDGTTPLRAFFWPIREFVNGLLLDRCYPLWQRLFLLGIFCQRLDAIAGGQHKRTFPEFVRDFSAVVASGSLKAPMETIAANPGLQLELVMELVRLRVKSCEARPWLVECLTDFHQGIGNGEGVAREALVAGYTKAFTTTWEPFFAERPWILENYLTNEVVALTFPLGDSVYQPAKPPQCMEAFARLVIRFGILKGLLIGVAGSHGKAFSEEHVVRTAQVVARHFEHSQEFVDESQAFLTKHKLADVAGLTALLRN